MQARTISLPSKTIPGVSFTFIRIGPRVRAKFDLDNAEMIGRLNEAESTGADLNDRLQKLLLASLANPSPASEVDTTEEMKELAKKLGAAQAQHRRIEKEEFNPSWVRHALLNISGEGLDEITADELIDLGPEALYSEIVEAIGRSLRMTPDQMQAFWLPSTSGAQVDGPKKASDAPTAEKPDSTQDEIAESIPSTQNS